MQTDAVFLDLYNKLRNTIKDEGLRREVEAKLFYVYLEPPPGCEPDLVLPLVAEPVYVPLVFTHEDVEKAIDAVGARLAQYGCVSADDVVAAVREIAIAVSKRLYKKKGDSDRQTETVREKFRDEGRENSESAEEDHLDDESGGYDIDDESVEDRLVDLLTKTVTEWFVKSGRAAVVKGDRLCVAAKADVNVVAEQPNYMVVKFTCRDGRTATYVISPLERQGEETEEAEEEGVL